MFVVAWFLLIIVKANGLQVPSVVYWGVAVLALLELLIALVAIIGAILTAFQKD